MDIIAPYLQMQADVVKPRPGNKYGSFADAVLDMGHSFESRALSDKEQAFVEMICQVMRTARYGECYMNAQRAVLRQGDGLGLKYAEGYAVCGLFPMLHGWIVLPSGAVFDPTWKPGFRPPKRRASSPVLGVQGKIPEGWGYYGIEFTPAQVRREVERREHYGSFLDNMGEHFPLVRTGALL